MNKYYRKILDNKDTFTIFYSDWCAYCQQAIKELKQSGLSYKGYKIDKISGGINKLIESLTETKDFSDFDPNHKTRPIIFRGGKFIGGYQDLKKYLENRNQSHLK